MLTGGALVGLGCGLWTFALLGAVRAGSHAARGRENAYYWWVGGAWVAAFFSTIAFYHAWSVP